MNDLFLYSFIHSLIYLFVDLLIWFICGQDKREFRCASTVEDGIAIYSRLAQLYTDSPNNFVKQSRPFPAAVGSAKFQKVSCIARILLNLCGLRLLTL